MLGVHAGLPMHLWRRHLVVVGDNKGSLQVRQHFRLRHEQRVDVIEHRKQRQHCHGV